jgi:crotonobetainyl-CoA:carnitine CoA-transferase CaiB-like acyl-CoA transferase
MTLRGWLDDRDGALGDVNVLDLTHYIAGPYCTKLFADYGPDVIKIEPPGGEGGRRLAPFVGDDPHPEKSGLFCFLNTNKRGLTLNLAGDSGREVFLALLEGADLVVESFRPGVLDELGIGWERIHAANPRCSLVSISNFGQSGPYRDYKASDLVLFAMGGEMYSMGVPEREPVKQGGTSTLYQSGAAAAAAAMGVLSGQRRQGVSQRADLSIFESHVGGADRRPQCIVAYSFSGRVNNRVPGSTLGLASGVYPCADGYVEIAGGGPNWDRTVRMLGSPEFLDDPKWTAPGAGIDPELKAEFDGFFYGWLLQRTKREVWAAGQEVHVLCSPLYTTADLVSDEHFRSRGFWQEIEREFIGRQTFPGRPFLMSESPWKLRRPAPTLGQHTVEILTSLGYDGDDILELRQIGVI